MGKLTDITPFRGLAEEEIAAKQKTMSDRGETRYFVKPERPSEITEDALMDVAYHEYQRHRHGQLEMLSIEEREIPEVLSLLRDNTELDVKQALELVRSKA